MVEFSPATREIGVRFPANAKTKFLKKYHCDEMLMQLQMFPENFCTLLIPCGLVVRIWHSLAHRHGPSSIPGTGILKAIFFNARTAESSQKQLTYVPDFCR